MENKDFLEYIDLAEEAERISKLYIRDAENPSECHEELQFRNRYRFQKNIVVHTILPLLEDRLQKINNRGLPITPIFQLLMCLRFYATGNFQTVIGDLRGISEATTSCIIRRVSSILLAERSEDTLIFPTLNNCRGKILLSFIELLGFQVLGTLQEINYNRAHMQTRNVVERSFELWKRKFPFLSKTLTTNLEISMAIICATALLHNISRRNYIFEGNNEEDEMPIIN